MFHSIKDSAGNVHRLGISFRHRQAIDDYLVYGKYKSATYCHLIDGTDRGEKKCLVGVGAALCSVKDQPNLVLARKISFGRAVLNFTKDRDLRAGLWAVYRNTHRLPY